jgi:Rrf2 family protein
MQLGQGVEWALHCATLLALVPEGQAMPASKLAEFHGVPSAYLSKTLQDLARAGVIRSIPGRRGGYRLGRPLTEITVLDVVEAVDGSESSFRCTEIRRRGPARVPERQYTPVCAIADVMHRADAAWREELRRTTLADLFGRLSQTVPPKAAVKAAAWMQEVTN